jgi:hypothetical protein
MPAMRELSTCAFRKALPGIVLLCGLGCAENPWHAGFSIGAATGSKTGNPFEIRLTAIGPDLKAVIVNRSPSEQMLLHGPHLQLATLELISSTGSVHKPYDSRLMMKYDATPYCGLFRTVAPKKKIELGSISFRQSRDGFSGQLGPFNFDELPPGDYQARVTWLSERSQCLDEATRKMRKLPTVWRGVVHSNQVTLHLP